MERKNKGRREGKRKEERKGRETKMNKHKGGRGREEDKIPINLLKLTLH